MDGEGGVDVEVGVNGLHVREAHVDDVRCQDVPVGLKLCPKCHWKDNDGQNLPDTAFYF